MLRNKKEVEQIGAFDGMKGLKMPKSPVLKGLKKSLLQKGFFFTQNRAQKGKRTIHAHP